MPVKCVTPSRAGFIVGTAAFVMVFNLLFVFPVYNHDCQEYHLQEVLRGPIPQDDPGLLKWVRSQLVPPSRLPYNLSLMMSGLYQEGRFNGSSYSPSQEFILGQLEDLFGDQITRPRTFIEAGAYDGEFLSNTLYLEHEFGWRGILVEANPTFFQQLLLKRRKSWAINVCLNTKPFPSQENFKVGSSSPEGTNHNDQAPVNPILEKHISLGSSGLAAFSDNKTQEGGMKQVQCVPLYSVVRAFGRTHIDFLSLDVEHAEMGILDTIPWDTLTFSVLAIEHLTKDDLVEYLAGRGYHHVDSLGPDHIFVRSTNVVFHTTTDKSATTPRTSAGVVGAGDGRGSDGEKNRAGDNGNSLDIYRDRGDGGERNHHGGSDSRKTGDGDRPTVDGVHVGRDTYDRNHEGGGNHEYWKTSNGKDSVNDSYGGVPSVVDIYTGKKSPAGGGGDNHGGSNNIPHSQPSEQVSLRRTNDREMHQDEPHIRQASWRPLQNEKGPNKAFHYQQQLDKNNGSPNSDDNNSYRQTPQPLPPNSSNIYNVLQPSKQLTLPNVATFIGNGQNEHQGPHNRHQTNDTTGDRMDYRSKNSTVNNNNNNNGEETNSLGENILDSEDNGSDINNKRNSLRRKSKLHAVFSDARVL